MSSTVWARLGAVAVLLSYVGCDNLSSLSSGGGTAGSVAGNYACMSTTHDVMTAPVASINDIDGTATLSVTLDGTMSTQVVLLGEGGIVCTLDLTGVDGGDAMLQPGQTCQSSTPGLTIQPTSGDVEFSGSEATLRLSFTFTGAEAGHPAAGSGTYSATCTKQ